MEQSTLITGSRAAQLYDVLMRTPKQCTMQVRGYFLDAWGAWITFDTYTGECLTESFSTEREAQNWLRR